MSPSSDDSLRHPQSVQTTIQDWRLVPNLSNSASPPQKGQGFNVCIFYLLSECKMVPIEGLEPTTLDYETSAFPVTLYGRFVGRRCGIRTHGAFTPAGFQDQCFRPLSQPSINWQKMRDSNPRDAGLLRPTP